MTLDWPLDSNKIRRGRINNTFGMVRRNSDGSRRPHQGWDFEALVGTETYAITDGTVEFVEMENNTNRGGYGAQICVKFRFSGTTLYALYAHLQDIHVWQGQKVSLGQTIGTTGDSGNARGMPTADEHLHFEIRTQARCGRGLKHRMSPIEIFRLCPLSVPEKRKIAMSLH